MKAAVLSETAPARCPLPSHHCRREIMTSECFSANAPSAAYTSVIGMGAYLLSRFHPPRRHGRAQLSLPELAGNPSRRRQSCLNGFYGGADNVDY